MNELTKYDWDLTKMFKNADEVYKALEKSELLVKDFPIIKSADLTDANKVFAILENYFLIYRTLSHIAVYNSQIVSIDVKNDENTSLEAYSTNRIAEFSKKLAYLPVLLTRNAKLIAQVKDDSKLEEYRYYLELIIKKSKHVLSENEEKLLIGLDQVGNGYVDAFSILINGEMKFDDVVDSTGKVHEVTNTTFSNHLQNEDRILRENSFASLYKGYNGHKLTIYSLFSNMLRYNKLDAEAHNYMSVKEKELSADDLPSFVVDDLIKNVRENLPVLHRYLAYKKKVLDLNEFSFFDLYTSLQPEFDQEIKYDDAVRTIIGMYSQIDEEYTEVLKEAFKENWIDVYPKENKRSGAYSHGSYDSVPYILLNYQNKLDDMYTLIHELGHSLHSYYARNNNTYFNSNYKIFVAEVASTVNELLLTNYLLKENENPTYRKYLLTHQLEQYRTTVFRQTLFAEFEDFAHSNYGGKDFSFTNLIEKYYQINQDYYAPEVELPQAIELEWLRIPHFYSPYYVFSYATSFCAAVTISEKIINEKGYFAKYKKFLKTANSMSPLESLKLCDIDFTKNELYDVAFKKMQTILDELEQN